MRLDYVVELFSEHKKHQPGIETLRQLAAERCAAEGHHQYVEDDGSERWENVPVQDLQQDVLEELADAFAYVSAIAYRTEDKEWLRIFTYLGLAGDKLQELANRNAAETKGEKLD